MVFVKHATHLLFVATEVYFLNLVGGSAIKNSETAVLRAFANYGF